MTMTINISPQAKAKLESEAAKLGQKPEDYLRMAVENTFLSNAEVLKIETGWDALTALIEACQMDTGIEDLAHQHDHYRLGTPKRED